MKNKNGMNKAFESAPVALAVIHDFIIQTANNKFLELTGYPHLELSEQSLQILFSKKNEFKRYVRELKDGLKNNNNISVQTDWLRKDKRVINVRIESSIIESKDKSIIFSIAVTENEGTTDIVTDVYQVLDHLPEGFVISDVEGRLLWCNNAFFRITGYRHEDLIGKHFMKTPIVPKKYFSNAIHLVKTMINRKQSDSLDLEYNHRDGTLHWASVRINRVKINKDVKGIQASFKDITNEKRTELFLDGLNKAAAESQKSISLENLFLAVKHEFKKVNLEFAILEKDRTQNVLYVKYHSFSKTLMKASEKLVNLKVHEYPVPTTDEFDEVFNNRTTILMENVADFIGAMLPASLKKLTSRIIEMFALSKYIIAPIIVDNNVIATIAVVSNQLVKHDIPAVTAFANQIAIAWKNASLFENMQAELTRRIETEIKLRKSEENYRILVENQNDLVVKIDKSGKLLYVSPSYCRMFGRTETDLLGKKFIPLIHPDDLDRTMREMKNLYHPPYTCYVEQRAMSKNGWVWLAWVDTAIVDSSGEVTEIIGIGRDITERIKSDIALRENEEKYRNLVERATDAIVMIQDSIIIYSNPKLFEILGYSKTEVIGTEFKKFVAPHELERVSKLYSDRIAGLPADPVYETQFLHKNQSFVDVEVNAGLVNFEKKATDLVMIRDISDRKRNEQALKLSNERLDLALKGADLGLWDMNLSTGKIYYNERYAKLLGYNVEELTKTADFWKTLIHPDDKALVLSQLEKFISGKIPNLDIEYRINTRDGDWKWLIDRGKVLETDAHGNAVRAVGVHLDITEKKAIEERLKISEQQNKEIVQALPDVILITDGKYRFLDVHFNDSDKNLLYAQPDLFIGKTVKEIMPSNVSRIIEYNIKNTLKTGKLHVFTYELVVDKEIKIFEARMVPSGGNKVLSIVRDITKQKRAEQDLSESEARFSAFMDSLPITAFIKTSDGRYVYFNHEFKKVYQADDWYGKTLFDIFPKELAEKIHYADQAAFEKGYGLNIHVVPNKLGEDRIWETHTIRIDRENQPSLLGGFSIDITERKKVENALKESELRYRTLFDKSTDPSLIINESIFIDCNDTTVKFLKYKSKKDIIGKHPWELSPEYQPDGERSIDKAYRLLNFTNQNTFNRFDWVHLDSEGNEIWVDVALTLIQDKGQSRIYTVWRDITERKQMEIERQDHLNFLEALDRVNRAIQGNNELDQMMSDVLDEVRGIFKCDRAWLHYPFDLNAKEWTVMMESYSSDYPGVFNKWGKAYFPVDEDMLATYNIIKNNSDPLCFSPGSGFPIPNGAKIFDVQSMMITVLYPKGDKPYLLGLMQCSRPREWSAREQKLFHELGLRITDALTSMLMFNNLRTSEANLAKAQRIAKIGSWKRSLQTNEFTLSEEICRIYGISCPSITDFEEWRRMWLSFIHPEDRDRVNNALNDAASGNSVYNVEYRIVLNDGNTRYIHAFAEVAKDEQKIPVRMFGTIQDITERKKAEDAIRKLNRDLELRVQERTAQLEAANKELEAFAYSVSHDLRAPLRSINGFSTILNEKYQDQLDSEAQGFLQRIVVNTERMWQLIDDILMLSRITRKELIIDSVNLSRLSTQIIDDLQQSEPKRKISIKIQENLIITGDLRYLSLVMENLIGNAWKYTNLKDDAQIEVGQKVVKNPNGIEQSAIYVRDNGVGFNMAYKDKLFKVFQRLHSDEKYPGNGVGLAIVQRIIHRHGGDVWAESKPNKGATFYFTVENVNEKSNVSKTRKEN